MMIDLVESIELSTANDDNDNTSDSGISPNDSEVEILLTNREIAFKNKNFEKVIAFGCRKSPEKCQIRPNDNL